VQIARSLKIVVMLEKRIDEVLGGGELYHFLVRLYQLLNIGKVNANISL
jgi:hypothetical protein